MALLYSFEYETAIISLRKYRKKTPPARWLTGAAMSLYHQLWDRPSKTDLQHGTELLASALAPILDRPRA